MRIPRLYTNQTLVPGAFLVIEGQAANRVTQVLRLRSGAPLRIFDGAGNEHHAILGNISRGSIGLTVGEQIPGSPEPALSITLAQGIARQDRMDLILQKAVELGVSVIKPLWMQRSQSHLKGERLAKRCQHWQGVIISACEQCGRNILPGMETPDSLANWIHTQPEADCKIMLQPDSPLTLADIAAPGGNIILLVGPEGGLNSSEQLLVKTAGFTGIRLGPRILRTETAALAAISGMQALWGDFR
jgi:16S rRNA (uracil1498-N3)-methyltransferase